MAATVCAELVFVLPSSIVEGQRVELSGIAEDMLRTFKRYI